MVALIWFLKFEIYFLGRKDCSRGRYHNLDLQLQMAAGNLHFCLKIWNWFWKKGHHSSTGWEIDSQSETKIFPLTWNCQQMNVDNGETTEWEVGVSWPRNVVAVTERQLLVICLNNLVLTHLSALSLQTGKLSSGIIPSVDNNF